MPEVDTPPTIAEIFDKARKAAAEDTTPTKGKNRHVFIVTPGRMLMLQPCPAPGTMNPHAVESIEKIMSSKTKRNVAVIAYTELRALQANLAHAIPFFGLISGLAYIGHSVWIFEGHSSALAFGCRDADLVIADGAMVQFLQNDWLAIASNAMRRPLIFAHDRATFQLRRLYPTVEK
ncbi:MAG: hypothetical protein HY257_08550 [Chloroflexi bacterium]|nr:hypothetical protein [Chloroflexota bacterium]